MAPSLKKIVALLALAFALALPKIIPSLMSLNLAPADDTIGAVPLLDSKQLSDVYAGKKALLIGGTRGVGYGTALAMAQAGSDVTLVGRSEKSGAAAVTKIRDATSSNSNVQFVQGDIGSVESSYELVNTLVARPERYDYLVMSAMVFPNWEAPTTFNVNGYDQSYAIGVIGRFIVYRNMHKFLRNDARVLNVLAAGEKPLTKLDRDFCSGKRGPKNLMDCLANTAIANELMLIGLEENDPTISGKVTLVSTHPGMLKTELHRGQGWAFDLVEAFFVSIMGISEEDCGVRQASILASDKLHRGNLSYVDLFLNGRARSSQLQEQVNENLDWLWSLLTGLENKSSSS